MMTESKVPEKIFICDKCLSPACFEGIFYCDDYKKAGTIEYIRADLVEPSYGAEKIIRGLAKKGK
jgi:hypothetical protein